MKYFSKAKLGELYNEDGFRAFVDEVWVDKKGSCIQSYSTQFACTKYVRDNYTELDYDKDFNEIPKSKLWREFYLETEFNLGDGFIDTGNGVFYEVAKIHVYCDIHDGSKIYFSYTICDVNDRTIMFNGEILSDHVQRGLFKYVKINNEINDVVEANEEDDMDLLDCIMEGNENARIEN